MGKRSDFKRRERDFYPTPEAAVLPLLPHIRGIDFFEEPCSGDGALVRHLHHLTCAICVRSSDVHPECVSGVKLDAMDITETEADCFITNPPWPAGPSTKGEPTVALALHLSKIAPTWFLLSADFAHNLYFRHLPCSDIVSVGRVKWIPGSKDTGKDNCAWYQFRTDAICTIFHPRRAK